MTKIAKNITPISVLIFLLLCGCTKSKEKYLLKINEFELSSNSFLASYNVAPSILKHGEKPKRSYLNAIKNEYLLSQYLISQGFGKDSTLSKTLRLFRQELIVEKMFKVDVDNKIIIDDKEIRTEILKGERQVKVKYIYSKDYEEAVKLKNELSRGISFEEIQESKLLNLGLSTDAGETGFINYGEVDKEVNDVIFSLPPNKVSDVIKTSAGNFILKVVDIRQSILSESDIVKLSPTYRKIILNRKMNEESRKYLKEFLDPKNIVVDGKVFKQFVNSIYPIYKGKRKSNNLNYEQNQEFFKVEQYSLSDEFLKEKIVSYSEGSITVASLLYHLSYYPVSFPTTSIDDFANSLKSKIGLRLRDIFMEKEGVKRGYQNDSQISEELDIWKNQIITYRYLQQLAGETVVDTLEVKRIYEDKFGKNLPFNKVQEKILSSYKDYLIYNKVNSIIEETHTNYNVFINSDLLEEINFSKDENVFGVDLYSYKMGLPYSRLAFAVPNRIWAAEFAWNSIYKN